MLDSLRTKYILSGLLMVPQLHNHLLDLPPVIALCYDKLMHLQDARPVALLRSVGCKDTIGANKRLACSMDNVKALQARDAA